MIFKRKKGNKAQELDSMNWLIHYPIIVNFLINLSYWFSGTLLQSCFYISCSYQVAEIYIQFNGISFSLWKPGFYVVACLHSVSILHHKLHQLLSWIMMFRLCWIPLKLSLWVMKRAMLIIWRKRQQLSA